ncbi:hypothetical protein ACIPLC_15690 [Kitasatospora sp. NPDC086801]|uniref:hypothetical protein n=1 Tax=unclassified Kitasatospora TaxID=2633591 RepID=UPI00382A9641
MTDPPHPALLDSRRLLNATYDGLGSAPVTDLLVAASRTLEPSRGCLALADAAFRLAQQVYPRPQNPLDPAVLTALANLDGLGGVRRLSSFWRAISTTAGPAEAVIDLPALPAPAPGPQPQAVSWLHNGHLFSRLGAASYTALEIALMDAVDNQTTLPQALTGLGSAVCGIVPGGPHLPAAWSATIEATARHAVASVYGLPREAGLLDDRVPETLADAARAPQRIQAELLEDAAAAFRYESDELFTTPSERRRADAARTRTSAGRPRTTSRPAATTPSVPRQRRAH